MDNSTTLSEAETVAQSAHLSNHAHGDAWGGEHIEAQPLKGDYSSGGDMQSYNVPSKGSRSFTQLGTCNKREDERSSRCRVRQGMHVRGSSMGYTGTRVNNHAWCVMGGVHCS